MITDLENGDYDEFDRARFFTEHHDFKRTDFERDRGRILHSSALRRLSAKTAVFSPTAGLDFARNRLTHTLEVAQVGRELGRRLGLDPDVVETACLAHDIGHPPFGHNGEVALDEWGARAGGFEGNAQTLRLLTRLEPKVIDDAGRSFGLNLTRASVDATCKYPWNRDVGAARVAEGKSSQVKYGVYADDEPVFEWLREKAPDGVLCVEAQTMDLADDIAYSVHDLEDAVVEGYLDLDELADPATRDATIAGVQEWTKHRYSDDDLNAALDRLLTAPLAQVTWDGTRRALASLKNLTSQLIGRFCGATTEATREAYALESLARYRANVIVPRSVRAEITVLKGVVGTLVMSRVDRQPYYANQRALLHELADCLLASDGAALDRVFALDWADARDDTARVRVVVDQVASLTDQSAIAWHDRLCITGAARIIDK